MSDLQQSISVKGIGKKYSIGKSRRGTLRETLSGLFVNKGSTEEFWALQNIDFEVGAGEAVGIIGRNGAGKSTLLKILSRITVPTTGRFEIHGRVSSLLEVGTGFHPELTGRENIFLNGTLLGMTRNEIRSKFDEIVAFSGVEKFLDTPVKHYSSGMYVRLAFSVAAHLEPEILIIDEVLAVGDAEFQRRCLGKMQDVTSQGRTVLFVSHNMTAVSRLCDKALVIDSGALKYEGPVEDAVQFYLSESISTNSGAVEWKDNAPGNENIRLKKIEVEPTNGDIINIDSGVEIVFEFHNEKEGINLGCTAELFNREGVMVFHRGVRITTESDSKRGLYRVVLSIPPFLLNANVYRLGLMFGESQRYLLFKAHDLMSFEVANTDTGQGTNLNQVPGVIRPNFDWKFEYRGDEG